MARATACCFWMLTVLCSTAVGQGIRPRPVHPVSFEIQVYLPDGQKPRQPVTLIVRSDDGRIHEVLYTSSSGLAYFTGVERYTPMTITVLPEKGFYRASSLSFSADHIAAEIYLKPDGPIRPVVSVGSLYEPAAKVRKLHEEGLRDLDKNRMQSAEEKLQEAAKLDAHYPAPLVALGFLRLHQQRWLDGEELFEKALKIDSTSPHALAGLGIARSRQGDFVDAVGPLETASAQLPDPEVLFHYALSLLETGRRNDAERILQQVAETPNPYQRFATLFLGRIYVERGDRKRGVATFTTLLNARDMEADLARKAIRLLQDEKGPK